MSTAHSTPAATVADTASRRKRGYVARGECRQSRSCYIMGCDNPACLAAHTRWTKQNRTVRLRLGDITHGPSGYDCGCRCGTCSAGRSLKYHRETLALLRRADDRMAS